MMRFPVALLAGALLAANAAAQQPAEPPPLPPPGRLVDVGGWRLHLHCTGEARPGDPIVVLEAGAGDFSVEWALVQPGVAQFARVCSYDRADDGWSDMGPHPRTMRQIVYELHTLLERAGERPPYLLVGQSFGAPVVRLYAATHPAEVAGMVLVDGGSDNPWRLQGDGSLKRSAELATGAAVPPVKASGAVKEADIPPAIRSQLEGFARERGPSANDGPRALLPADARRMRSWALGQVKHWASGDNPFEHEELAAIRAVRTGSEHPLGELPLLVITRGVADDSPELEAEHRREQEATARMSRRGRLIVAERSGHHVQLEQPDLVVAAIREALAATR